MNLKGDVIGCPSFLWWEFYWHKIFSNPCAGRGWTCNQIFKKQGSDRISVFRGKLQGKIGVNFFRGCSFLHKKTKTWNIQWQKKVIRLDLKKRSFAFTWPWVFKYGWSVGIFFILVKVSLVPRSLPLFDISLVTGKWTFICDYCYDR